jgi:hypothetical protein
VRHRRHNTKVAESRLTGIRAGSVVVVVAVVTVVVVTVPRPTGNTVL